MLPKLFMHSKAKLKPTEVDGCQASINLLSHSVSFYSSGYTLSILEVGCCFCFFFLMKGGVALEVLFTQVHAERE